VPKLKLWGLSQVDRGTAHGDTELRSCSKSFLIMCATAFQSLTILRQIFIATFVIYKGTTSKPTDTRTS